MKVKAILRSSKTHHTGDDKLAPYFKGWFYERFGDHYAQISVDTTLKLKSAVKDVARALHRFCPKCRRNTYRTDICEKCGIYTTGFVPKDIEKLTHKFILPPQGVSDHHFVLGHKTDEGYVMGSVEYDPALQAYIEKYPDDWFVVKQCLGLARQKGRHACAFVIANRPIHEFIPMTTVGGVQVTAFTAPAVEAVGGLKMDFLVITSLKFIQDALHLIQARHRDVAPDPHNNVSLKNWNPWFQYSKVLDDMTINDRLVPNHRLLPLPEGGYADIWDLPEDQTVFKDVSYGRTETVFQFNTPSAVQWLEHFNHTKPDGRAAIDSIEAMAAFTALDRPGPLNVMVQHPEQPDETHNMLVEYARRARGATGSQSVLPILEELVPETYGVMTYQEQLQKVYQNLTGCSGTEAEAFRGDVAKKQKEKVDAAYPLFMERAGAKVGAEDAQKLWDFIKTWAEYGFNKSHAVSYVIISYACAYLKHHYPLEWWCAVLRNADKDDINNKFWQHCGHLVSLPDVKLSRDTWFIEGDKIRAPVNLLLGIGEKAHEQLCKYAPYANIKDFAKAMQQAKVDNTTVVKDADGNDKTVNGRSAIHRGTVHTFIVSGAMESLFPEGSTVEDCLALFDEACKEVQGKAYKKPEDKYIALDPLGRYQARKSILPAYGADLRPIARWLELPDFLSCSEDGKKMRYHWRRWNRQQGGNEDMDDPVIGAARLTALNTSLEIPDGGWRCAVLGYVEAIRSWKFTKDGETTETEACELTLEVGGGKYKFVHWAGKDGTLPDGVKSLTPGTIVAALLVRSKTEYPFSVREVRVLRDELKVLKKEKEKKPDEQD